MNNLIDLYNSEPAVVIGAIAGFVGALIVAAVSFGLPVSVGQKSAILGLVAPALALAVPIISGLVTRSKVSPVPPVAKAAAPIAAPPAPVSAPPAV